MAKIVVTTGKRYTDIDGLACVIAYKEIPEVETIAVLPGRLNLSVNSTIRAWKMDYLDNISAGDYDFVITDVSEESQFAAFVDPKRVIEIYDHHYGFEKYWQDRLGEKAKIEPIGSCATLIWEEFVKRKLKLEAGNEKLDYDVRNVTGQNQKISPPPSVSSFSPLTSHFKISSIAANLLYTAIFANTLNFKASITADRDKKAYEELKPFIDLPPNWVAQYYHDIETDVYANPGNAIREDTKIQIIKGQKCAISQVELWNSSEFLKSHLDEIQGTLKSFGTEYWFLTSPSISEGRNYLFTKDEAVKDWLKSVMAIDFFGTDIGVTDRLWLRKEILKKIQ